MAVVDLSAPSRAFAGYKIRWGVGSQFFTAQGTDLDHSLKAEEVDGSGFGTRFKNNIPGMLDGTLKISGLASSRKGQVMWYLNQILARTSAVNMWYATEGLDALSPCAMQPASLMELSPKGKMKDSVTFDASFSARGDANPIGVILASPKTTNVLTAATGAGSIDDNTLWGGASTFGGAAQLHFLDLSGGTTPTVAVKVRHSTDGITFADIPGGTFATVNTTDLTTWSQRINIPSTQSINAQVRIEWTTTGTPTSVQPLVIFARNYDPDL
jgi:hypothetical protein